MSRRGGMAMSWPCRTAVFLANPIPGAIRAIRAPGWLGREKERSSRAERKSPLNWFFLLRLGVSGQSLAIDFEIALVHQHRARIHEGGHWCRQGRAPVFELVHGVVVQVVEELQPVVTHDVRLLRDRGRYGPLVDPIERLRIVVERK